MLEAGGPTQVQHADFHFVPLLDGLGPEISQHLTSVCVSVRRDFLCLFRDLIDKLNSNRTSEGAEDASPPVTCIVSDGFMTFSIRVAEELGIPVAMFFTISACAFMGILQYRDLKDRGIVPLKENSYITNGYLNTTLDWIPGMKDIQLKDLPTFLRTTDPDDILFNIIMESADNAPRATTTILHTFDVLETEILRAVSPLFSSIHAIGPLQLLLDHKAPADPLRAVDYNPWNEDTECLKWLDSKETGTVIYVNFGSIAVLTLEQLIEIGMGLAMSKYHFLWVIRPNLVVGESASLPPEFAAKTEGRGFITSWCPQERVLNHPSVGGFLTHCGWNSIMESIVAGVPMICWPFLGDQQTNCRFCCREWGIGMEINEDVNRVEVVKLVKELMEGGEGRIMKERVMEWKQLAREAVGPDGSSAMNFDKLLHILS
ncbi:7-deoxyloganetin glucosyltransferase-like [Punica granatum]|uniref:Glycosyltransferase n=1 Tax=Punica granatum TaxID=22663 RepID=A0A6P8EA41_PUNGR|nr:7-deoxyloganetin glucosyltransferase-like [Punica granatum]